MNDKIKELYISGLSSQEIKDTLLLPITVRQIQRKVKSYGIARTVTDSYHNAMKRNRINWAYKKDKTTRHKINPTLRYKILQRDNFKCILCGNKELLEIDHINDSKETNLQVLCHLCNQGKHWNK